MDHRGQRDLSRLVRRWQPGGANAFVAAHIAGHGALGEFFATLLGGTIKMGDSPSVGYLLRGTSEDPSLPSWGGQFVRAWERRDGPRQVW